MQALAFTPCSLLDVIVTSSLKYDNIIKLGIRSLNINIARKTYIETGAHEECACVQIKLQRQRLSVTAANKIFMITFHRILRNAKPLKGGLEGKKPLKQNSYCLSFQI